MKELTGAKLPS